MTAEELQVFTSERVQAGRTRRFTLTRAQAGWSVREELESQVVRTTHYQDWHRVERAIEMFEMQGEPVAAQ